MADELHPVERVVDAHRGGGVLLLADDHGAAGLGEVGLVGLGLLARLRVLLGRVLGRSQGLGHLLVRGHGAQARAGPLMGANASAAVILAPVSGAAESFEELAVSDVERAVEVVGTGFGADHRPVLVHGELDPVAELGLTGVLLLRDLHVDAERRGSELGDLVELLGEMTAETIRDVHVTSDDIDLHEWFLLLSGCGRSEPGRDGSSAGCAPPDRGGLAHVWRGTPSMPRFPPRFLSDGPVDRGPPLPGHGRCPLRPLRAPSTRRSRLMAPSGRAAQRGRGGSGPKRSRPRRAPRSRSPSALRACRGGSRRW